MAFYHLIMITVHLGTLFINPRCACAARVTVVGCALICCLTHWNHKREIPTDSSHTRTVLNFADFAKNASFESYGVICSPRAAPAS